MAFLHGFCLALGLIVPLGVQNLFVFQQGIVQPKFSAAMPAVITAALCDMLLIILAVNGVSVFLVKFMLIKNILVFIGAIFLFYMGYLNWNSSSINKKDDHGCLPASKQIFFATSVSLFNPYAFLDILGVIGTSSIYYKDEEKIIFTVACIMVSWIWFFGLAFAGRKVGAMKELTKTIKLINKISSLFIWGTGIFLLYTLK